jgi:hypothetical protein
MAGKESARSAAAVTSFLRFIRISPVIFRSEKLRRMIDGDDAKFREQHASHPMVIVHRFDAEPE